MTWLWIAVGVLAAIATVWLAVWIVDARRANREANDAERFEQP